MFSKKPEPQSQFPTASADAKHSPLPPASTPPAQAQASSQSATQPLSNTNSQTARTTTMAPTIIGPDFKITGHAISNGEVQVDGEIEGDIECATLVVGQSAKVTGNVIAENVTVQGKVMGSIRGANVTLQASAHIEGDVYHQSLAIEQGAFFEGKSRRSDNPVGEAPKLADRGSAPGLSGPNGSTTLTGDVSPSTNGKNTSGGGLIAGS